MPRSITLEQYESQSHILWKQIPTFNVLQVRWFQNLLEVYSNDLQDVSLRLATQPSNTDLQAALVRASSHVELLKFMISTIETKVK